MGRQSRIPYKLVLALFTALALAVPASVGAERRSGGSGRAHVSAGSQHSSGGHSARSSGPRSHVGSVPSPRTTRTSTHVPRASGTSSATTGISTSHSRAVPGVARDNRGRIARSSSAKKEFQKSHPCPATGRTSGPCGGYVVDHVMPLKRGGADRASNMQWQTTAQAKAKDRVE